MTLTLATLRDRYVFESTPQRHDLGALHVPFDELVGDGRTEARLNGAASDEIADRTETVTTTRRGGLAAGWAWIGGDLAREVKRQTEIERTATFADKTDVLIQVLETIAGDDLHPVLVFDDTDRWLTNGGPDLVRRFFGEGLRWLLELPAGMVVAVHPNYLAATPQAELLQYLDTQITIPHLPDPAHIGTIFNRRIELYAGIDNPDLYEAIGNDALIAIHDVYEATGSLRRAIHVCHTAVQDALDAGDANLNAPHVAAAANAG